MNLLSPPASEAQWIEPPINDGKPSLSTQVKIEISHFVKLLSVIL